MIHLITGHRGSGKSQFLKATKKILSAHWKGALFFDLDNEIESRQGKSIEQVFSDSGEETFRELEQATLAQIVEENSNFSGEVFVSIGAGYLGPGLDHLHTIWVQRTTDRDGRIFLNRPRLHDKVTPLEEYRERYTTRSLRYAESFDEVCVVPEGFYDHTRWLEVFFNLLNAPVNVSMTLLPEHLQDEGDWKEFISRRLHWGIKYFEIRDDLLSPDQQRLAFDWIDQSKRLYSVRDRASEGIPEAAEVDWALEVGEPPELGVSLVSLHNRNESETLESCFSKLERHQDKHLKLAVTINNFSELSQAHAWWSQDPARRSFLPRSHSGRWRWYRLLQKGRMKLNFIREGEGSAVDQPYFAEWVMAQSRPEHFAAVLGYPVHHSLTPSEHMNFFSDKNMSVVCLPMEESECTTENLMFLKELGLTHAAVTSPLKKAMFSLCVETTAVAKEMASVNTIELKPQGLVGTNTDIDGLRKLLSDRGSKLGGDSGGDLGSGPDSDSGSASGGDSSCDLGGDPGSDLGEGERIAVWGGGGAQEAIRKCLPKADFFSARTGECTNSESLETYDTLIWAVGRSRMKDCKWPNFTVNKVIDLNYTEDSPGLELAQKIGAEYKSGLKMFRAQAKAQRDWWGHAEAQSSY